MKHSQNEDESVILLLYLPIFTTPGPCVSEFRPENLQFSWQVLVANLFSHGEIGVDAIASPSAQPDADTPLGRVNVLFTWRWKKNARISYK